MKITFAFIFLISLIVGLLYFFTGYNSAFEADQQCHYQKSSFEEDYKTLGCDHDIETRQWILYNLNDDNLPAEVLKRFKY